MVIRTIKLTSLFVNTENYRFEPLSSQKEAIDKMIEDQGDKLYSLVDDIVTNGLSPVDLIIVTPNEDSNKYVVLEGNRRITSLKLLNNPTLIDDKYSPLRKKFQKLQKYNPQIQISAESETKRSIFRKRDKTKRSKKESAQHSKSRNKSFVMTSVSAL